MMKKVLILTVVTVMMVMALGVAANAYLFYFKAYGDSSDNNGGNILVGTVNNSSGSFNPPSGAYYALAVPTAQTWTPTNATNGSWLWKDVSSTAFPNNSFMLAAWASPDAKTTTATIKIWSTNAASLPAGKWSVTNAVTGEVLCAPFAYNATKNSETSYMASFTVTLPKTSTPEKDALALRFSVPEPGSMLAMLSGLVGLVGFGIRRRK